MNYAPNTCINQPALSALNNISQTAMPAGTNQLTEGALVAITSRIHSMADIMQDEGSRLRNHADAVFGAREVTEPPLPNVVREDGLIGALHGALDRLELAHSEVATQISRNCTLA